MKKNTKSQIEKIQQRHILVFKLKIRTIFETFFEDF